MAKLTNAEVKSLKPGPKVRRHGDGRGLYLVLKPSGARSWVQRIAIAGRRTDIGLGGYPGLSLAKAREKSQEVRSAVAEGLDPRAPRRPAVPIFSELAEQYIRANASRWKNAREARDWRTSLQNYVYPTFGSTRIDKVTRADVLTALLNIWDDKQNTAKKVRQRVRVVFASAMAHGYIDQNPAGEVIDAALPKTPAVRAHFRALPYKDVPAVLKAVEDSGAASLTARLCLRFLVLTATRSGESVGARWDEIDLESRTWTIPAERMKAGRQHRVPLSRQALDVLIRAQGLSHRSELVFPSTARPGAPQSHIAPLRVLRGLGLDITVHGFRTSFKTWCMETTDIPWAVGEAALAHTIGNSVEAAYARSDLFTRRAAVMQQWADYAAPEPFAG